MRGGILNGMYNRQEKHYIGIGTQFIHNNKRRQNMCVQIQIGDRAYRTKYRSSSGSLYKFPSDCFSCLIEI